MAKSWLGGILGTPTAEGEGWVKAGMEAVRAQIHHHPEAVPRTLCKNEVCAKGEYIFKTSYHLR